MVRVNTKPQYLVFSCHFWNPHAKYRQSAVESSKGPCGARVRRLKFAPFLVQLPLRDRSRAAQRETFARRAAYSNSVVPFQPGKQGARTVQFCRGLCELWRTRQGSGIRGQRLGDGYLLDNRWFYSQTCRWRKTAWEIIANPQRFPGHDFIDAKVEELSKNSTCVSVKSSIRSQELIFAGIFEGSR